MTQTTLTLLAQIPRVAAAQMQQAGPKPPGEAKEAPSASPMRSQPRCPRPHPSTSTACMVSTVIDVGFILLCHNPASRWHDPAVLSDCLTCVFVFVRFTKLHFLHHLYQGKTASASNEDKTFCTSAHTVVHHANCSALTLVAHKVPMHMLICVMHGLRCWHPN